MTTRAFSTILTTKSRAELTARLRTTLDWPKWSSFSHAVIDRPGRDGQGSPGEIRRFTLGKTVGREEVLENDGDVVVRYRLLEGLPMKNYVGEVSIIEEGSQRRVNWSSTFDVPFGFGWLASWQMSRFFAKLLTELVAD